jgi:hypothetical protein
LTAIQLVNIMRLFSDPFGANDYLFRDPHVHERLLLFPSFWFEVEKLIDLPG